MYQHVQRSARLILHLNLLPGRCATGGSWDYLKFLNIELFDTCRIEWIKIINAGDLYPRLIAEQSFNKVTADKAGTAGDEIMFHNDNNTR